MLISYASFWLAPRNAARASQLDRKRVRGVFLQERLSQRGAAAATAASCCLFAFPASAEGSCLPRGFVAPVRRQQCPPDGFSLPRYARGLSGDPCRCHQNPAPGGSAGRADHLQRCGGLLCEDPSRGRSKGSVERSGRCVKQL